MCSSYSSAVRENTPETRKLSPVRRGCDVAADVGVHRGFAFLSDSTYLIQRSGTRDDHDGGNRDNYVKNKLDPYGMKVDMSNLLLL